MQSLDATLADGEATLAGMLAGMDYPSSPTPSTASLSIFAGPSQAQAQAQAQQVQAAAAQQVQAVQAQAQQQVAAAQAQAAAAQQAAATAQAQAAAAAAGAYGSPSHMAQQAAARAAGGPYQQGQQQYGAAPQAAPQYGDLYLDRQMQGLQWQQAQFYGGSVPMDGSNYRRRTPFGLLQVRMLHVRMAQTACRSRALAPSPFGSKDPRPQAPGRSQPRPGPHAAPPSAPSPPSIPAAPVCLLGRPQELQQFAATRRDALANYFAMAAHSGVGGGGSRSSSPSRYGQQAAHLRGGSVVSKVRPPRAEHPLPTPTRLSPPLPNPALQLPLATTPSLQPHPRPPPTQMLPAPVPPLRLTRRGCSTWCSAACPDAATRTWRTRG
jgi:hypothetical protein